MADKRGGRDRLTCCGLLGGLLVLLIGCELWLGLWDPAAAPMARAVGLAAGLAFCSGLAVQALFQRLCARESDLAFARLQDVSRQARTRHQLIAEQVHDIIVRADASGRILYVSPACRAYGYEPADLIGKDASDLIHPDDLVRHGANMQLLFEGQIASAKARQLRYRHCNGQYGWMQGNPALIRDEAGRPQELVSVLRDITEHKAMEAALDDARKNAEAAARSKSAFLANVTHELRTPLTSIIGFTRLALEHAQLTDAPRTYVERIGHAGQALLGTINDVLDFSKLEAGQLRLSPRPTPIRPALAQALDLFEPQAREKGLELVLDTDAGENLGLLLDPDRLRQVLLNLLGNAAKFTQAGRITLRSRYDAVQQVLTVWVEDTGPGISDAGKAQLFQRFSQVEGAPSPGGTGLGLAICKGIVEAWGGQISVDTCLGAGSVFCFTLPARTVDMISSGAPPDRSLCFAGLKVLVADDHPANREVVGLMLATVGAVVLEARSAHEAVALATSQTFDLILMDLRMPGRDGRQALADIRTWPGLSASPPILAFTADATPDLESRLLTEGFQGVVGKPVAADALFATIARVLKMDVESPALSQT